MHITTLTVIAMYIAYWEKLDQKCSPTGEILLSLWLHVNQERNDDTQSRSCRNQYQQKPQSVRDLHCVLLPPVFGVARSPTTSVVQPAGKASGSYAIDTSLDTRFTSYFLDYLTHASHRYLLVYIINNLPQN